MTDDDEIDMFDYRLELVRDEIAGALIRLRTLNSDSEIDDARMARAEPMLDRARRLLAAAHELLGTPEEPREPDAS